MPKRRSLRERFTAQTLIAESGCWIWAGATGDTGYGVIGAVSFSARTAHRGGFTGARFRQGSLSAHRCDVAMCVNPDHLFLGTHADNMRDMAAKGRSASGARNGRTVLTPALAAEIRAERQAHGTTYAQLSKRFGLSYMTTARAARGDAWCSRW